MLLKVDFNNAFNMVSRSAFLSIVREKYPEYFNWINCCYGDRSTLDYQSFPIDSASGVQQGDPLGPLLFALPLSILTAQIKAKYPYC